MASEISVERAFRFHCSCGATTVTGERTVPCTGCGMTLGVRRVRRHRQQSGSVAYYGSRTPSALRAEKRHSLNPAARLGAWLKSALPHRSEVIKVRRVERRVLRTNTVPQVEAPREVRNESRELPRINESPRKPFLEGAHVKVGPTHPDGTPHPHAGKTGRITKLMNWYSDPYWLGLPSALIKLDLGIEPQGFIWVSLASLEALPENTT
jgi:hypothetical protein